jgi:hypothetical protein
LHEAQTGQGAGGWSASVAHRCTPGLLLGVVGVGRLGDFMYTSSLWRWCCILGRSPAAATGGNNTTLLPYLHIIINSPLQWQCC